MRVRTSISLVDHDIVPLQLTSLLPVDSMGNLVFRYFLEWLRVEMRQEVYAESFRRQRRRAESWKRQRIQQIQQKRTPEETDGVSSGWTADLPGWISGAAEVDRQQPDDLKRKTDPKEEVLDIDTESTLWELAKEEGDEKFFEWLEKHIWTVSVRL